MNASRAGGEMNRSESTDLRQAEQELRERERQLDSLMGHLPGLVYRALADEHWTCLFVSKGIEAVTGYTPDDFTSRRVNYIDIILPEDRQATREAILTALRERGTYEDGHRIRHKDGSIRWIWARGHGVFAPDRSVVTWIGRASLLRQVVFAWYSQRAAWECPRPGRRNTAPAGAFAPSAGEPLRIAACRQPLRNSTAS